MAGGTIRSCSIDALRSRIPTGMGGLIPMGINWNLWGHVIGIYVMIGIILSWVGFMMKHTKNYSRVKNPSWKFEVALIMSWPVLATWEFLRHRKKHP
jgi:hypothetical protein